MKNLIGIFFTLVTIICLSCSNPQKVNLDTEVQALRQAGKSWSEAAISKDAKRYVEFYDKDGIVIEFNGQINQNKDTILKSITSEFLTPGYSLSWNVQNAVVAKAGDLGYTTGSYDMQWTTEKGEQMKEHGPYLVIWKKQVDGSWKAIVDSYWKAK